MPKNTNQTVKGCFTIANDKGLHTRPSTELVRYASTFKSNIHLTYQKVTVNAKSLLGILMLAATKGTKIYIEAEGEDAQKAVDTIIELSKNKFHIKY
ncbi:Phosphocarrier protein HPr [Chlamydiales bacterium SCGC AB-751-O23]|jgi:phosphocarrier protein HPr|nr:Phosphocarrier protein HPr [Chlamydiales bacterium SCGC AB-751-O23]